MAETDLPDAPWVTGGDSLPDAPWAAPAAEPTVLAETTAAREWAKKATTPTDDQSLSAFGTPISKQAGPFEYQKNAQIYAEEAKKKLAEGQSDILKAVDPRVGHYPGETLSALGKLASGAFSRVAAPVTAAVNPAWEYATGIPGEEAASALMGPEMKALKAPEAILAAGEALPKVGTLEEAGYVPRPKKDINPSALSPTRISPEVDVKAFEKALLEKELGPKLEGAPAGVGAAGVSPLEKAAEFDIPLSRGQAEQDMGAIRFEDMASRGAYGEPAQDIAKPWFETQFKKVGEAGEGIGERLAGEHPVAASPSEAASTVNADIAARAAEARHARGEAQARAQEAGETQRGLVADQARAIEDAFRGASLPIENIRETGEVVAHDVRAQAAADRDHYRELYNEAFALPGEFHAGAFEGIGRRIQGEISRGETPVIIDDVTTPIASRAIRDLDNISNLRIQNRADPAGAPNPENIVGVDLRGVDQTRKRLVEFYKAARSGAPLGQVTPDVRAVGEIIEAFDNQVEHAIANGLFSGDERALAALQEARAAYRRYAQTYRPRGAGDDVGSAIRRIVDRQATPEETVNLILGSGRIGNSGLPVRLADRLEQILGADSDAWSTIRQAMWQRASQVRNAAGKVDPVRSAANIEQFANSSLGRRMFAPNELAAMRAHARAVRQLDRAVELLPETEAAARAARGYEEMFGGEGIGGPQQAVFRRIVEGTATPEETANAVFGAIGSGNPGNAVRMVDAIERIVGSPSPTMAAMRQGVWQKLTQAPVGKDQPGAQKLAQSINEFLNGRGKGLSERLYTPNELALMQRYADVVKRTVIPPRAATRPDTAIAMGAMVRNAATAVSSALLSHIPLVGRFAHLGVDKLLSGISNAAEARKVAQSLDYSKNAVPKTADMEGGLNTPEVGRQPLKRTVIRRDSRGRPVETVPLNVGSENEILKAAQADSTTSPQKTPKQILSEAENGMVSKYNEDIPSIDDQYSKWAQKDRNYDEISSKEAEERIGDREDWPEELRKIIDRHGKAVEISDGHGNTEWYAPNNAPSKTEFKKNAVIEEGGLLPAEDIDDIYKGLAQQVGGVRSAGASAFLHLAESMEWKLADGKYPSSYMDIVHPNSEHSLHVRVSDHPNLTRSNPNASRPDINLAPGAHDFEDAVRIMQEAAHPEVGRQPLERKVIEHDARGRPMFASGGAVALCDDNDKPPEQQSTAADWQPTVPLALATGGAVPTEGGDRIKRDAFLYMENPDDSRFAQCGTCWLFRKHKQRCAILPSDFPVTAKDSCGYYLEGKPDSNAQISHKATPQEVGFVKATEVRCANCKWGGPTCKLYEALNREAPDKFDLDTKISPRGCCNAFKKAPVERASGGRIMPHYIDSNPSEAQKEVGNYRKQHITAHGLDFTIENAKGSWRQGTDKNGEVWRVQLPYSYGYLKRTTAADSDHIDAILGPHRQSKKVFVIDQVDADTGKYDEAKCCFFFGSPAQAKAYYLKGFSDGKGHKRLGHMTEMSIDAFRQWLKDGDTTKPLHGSDLIDRPKINHTKDVRWLSELNRSGNEFFYDRSSPRRIINNGKPLDPVEPLIRHEMAEYKYMKQAVEDFKAKHGREPNDAERAKIYHLGHKDHGNVAERDWLVANGYSIPQYNSWCRIQLARLQKKAATHPPTRPDVKVAPHQRGDLEYVGAA